MSDSSYSASSSPSRANEMEAFATLSIRFSSHVILPSSRTSAGFGSIDFGSMPRGRSRWRFNFLPASVKLWTLRVTVCRFAFLSYAMSSSTQTTPMIFVIVASRTGTFLFTIFADLSAIRGRMSWTISNFSFVFARWAFFVRCVLRRRPASFSARSSSVMISSAVATASFDSDVYGTFVEQRCTRTIAGPNGRPCPPRVRVEAGGIAEFLRDAGRHPHELLLEERGELVGLRLLHHGHERAKLDSMRMRRDFLCLRREILRDPLEDDFFALRRPICN